MASLLMRRRVEIAISEEPDKSDSALAEELDLDKKIVRDARKALATRKPGKLRCVACGHTQEAGCLCDAVYVALRPGELAKRAIAETPEKSNRRIARELKIDESTVREARWTAQHHADREAERNAKRAGNPALCSANENRKPTDGERFQAQLQSIMDDIRATGNNEWSTFNIFWDSCSKPTRAGVFAFIQLFCACSERSRARILEFVSGEPQ
jgi:hypothetical protein